MGATRLDLQGQPAGVVTADIELAQANQAARAAAARAALPPNDTLIPKEHLVPGRLELTVKFSELPQPLRVQDGVKIGVQTGMGIVTALLPPPLWRTLERAAQDYPRWLAVLSGALDRFADGEIALKHPTLRVFEKKAKPEATPEGKGRTERTGSKAPDAKASEAKAPVEGTGPKAEKAPAVKAAAVKVPDQRRRRPPRRRPIPS